ncbi:MAG: hypothetical protein ACRDT6_23070, partial [Micromonosporaceae bacterium]
MSEPTSRSDRLDPARLPRMKPLLRYATVATLLVLAAGVLLLDRPAAPTRPIACRAVPSAEP